MMANPEQANMGLATTRELLSELAARFDLSEWEHSDLFVTRVEIMLGELPESELNYRTVNE